MTTEDGADAAGTDETAATGSGSSGPLANVPVPEQLIALGALLVVLVVDLLGDIILDDYGVSKITWVVSVAVVVLVWARRLGNKEIPLRYASSLMVLGYAGLVLGARELLDDIDASIYEGSTTVFALVSYAGAILMGYGAYRLSRSD